jgi:uracil-DNA glycosylase family protein
VATHKDHAEWTGSAADFFPARRTLRSLVRAAASCQGCDLYLNATQTVFGEGNAGSDVMLVGEQPGDHEDVEGHPFVGPAGHLLDTALERAGIDRRDVYITNVVKHFRFEPRGKRRIHRKPSAEQVRACRPWLEAELELVAPKVVVCLGATAAQALLGRSFKLTEHRGEFVEWDLEPLVTATVHPSAILRAPDDRTREEQTEGLVRDLRSAARAVEREPNT